MVCLYILVVDQRHHVNVGFCDYGNYITLEDKMTLAKEALVFLLVSVKGKWKWPIAYFFKRAITKEILRELIETALILTAEVQLNMRAIICDGESVNCSALNLLGCNIFSSSFADLQNSFPHPVLNYKVKVMLDACHMLKLARNSLADYKTFCSNDENLKWEYIVQLYKLQKQLKFKFKNQLSSQCIHWKQNKMKVKYATKTLSASVATAIIFLKNENLQNFQGCEATTTFIETIDWLFDVLNSRSPCGKSYKQPLTRHRLLYIKPIIIEKINYLYQLKTVDGALLVNSEEEELLFVVSLGH